MYKTYRFVRPESIKIDHNPEVTKLEFEEFTTGNLELQRAVEYGKITTLNKAQLFDIYRPEEMRRGFVIQDGYGLDLLEKLEKDKKLAESSSVRPIQGWTKDNRPIFEHGLTNSDPDPYLQDGPVKKLIKFVNTELDSFSIWDYEEKLDKLSDEELDVFIEELSNVLV
jgi:hypothetical protein